MPFSRNWVLFHKVRPFLHTLSSAWACFALPFFQRQLRQHKFLTKAAAQS
jgi:hypothetical protein